MNTTRITLAMLFMLLVAASCQRENDVLVDPPGPVAGKTGMAMLKITPRHHLKLIDSCHVYIKYNAATYPVNNMFDDSARCFMDNGKPTAIFDSLNRGSYYLYARGFDPEVATKEGGAPVTGGGPVVIYDSARTYEIFIDVTEAADHVRTPQD